MNRRFVVVAVLAALLPACAGGTSADTTAPSTTLPVTTTSSVPPTTTPPETSTTTTPAPTTTTVPPTTTTVAVPAWTPLAGAGAPSARSNPVLVVDPVGQSLYLHGGRAGGAPLADLWRFDLASGTWTELTVDGAKPSPRFSHTAVWDEQRDRLVVFSGQGSGFEFFGDVWAYDPATGQWTELAAGGTGPADRYGSCAGYDPAGDRFLISHGFTDRGRFDDTWAFSLADQSWTDISPDAPRPVERCLHTCAYDQGTGSLVLFGGQTDDQFYLGDTWVLDGSGWRESVAAGPSPRQFPSSVARDDGVLLFGGVGEDGPVADGWVLEVEADRWTMVPADGPEPRHSHGAAADPSTGDMYVFGGEGSDGELADLWVLTP